MSKVEHVQFGKCINHKVMLRQLADCEDLKGVAIICVWNDNVITSGNSGIRCSDMALGALMLQDKAMREASIDDE